MKKAFIIVSQLNSGCKPEATLFRQKPQIVSVPGISPKERNRYRVTLGGQVLGDQLTIAQAIALANQSTHH